MEKGGFKLGGCFVFFKKNIKYDTNFTDTEPNLPDYDRLLKQQ